MPCWDKTDIETLEKVVATDVPSLMGEVGGISTVQVSCRETESTSNPRLLGRLFRRPKRDQSKCKAKVSKKQSGWGSWWLLFPLVLPVVVVYCAHVARMEIPSSFASLLLDTCEPKHCTSGHVFKTAPPPRCSGRHCTQTECCDRAGMCESSHCSSGSVLMHPPPLHCKSTLCTQAECCEEERLIPESAGWWSCKHDGMHPCKPGPGCCCDPGTSYDKSGNKCSASFTSKVASVVGM